MADCFRHRSKVGLDVALESLREAIQKRRCTPDELIPATQSAHVWTSLRPLWGPICGGMEEPRCEDTGCEPPSKS